MGLWCALKGMVSGANGRIVLWSFLQLPRVWCSRSRWILRRKRHPCIHTSPYRGHNVTVRTNITLGVKPVNNKVARQYNRTDDCVFPEFLNFRSIAQKKLVVQVSRYLILSR